MLIVRDSNHVLHKHIQIIKKLQHFYPSLLNIMLKITFLLLFHLVYISTQILLHTLSKLAHLPQPHTHHSLFSYPTCLHSSYPYLKIISHIYLFNCLLSKLFLISSIREHSLTFSSHAISICSLKNKVDTNIKHFLRNYKQVIAPHNNKIPLFLKMPTFSTLIV